VVAQVNVMNGGTAVGEHPICFVQDLFEDHYGDVLKNGVGKM